MNDKEFPTIKALVFDFIHHTNGRMSYEALEEAVLSRFPKSAFKKTHWVWYRYQCTKGRFANEFSASEKRNMRTGTQSSHRISSQLRQDAQDNEPSGPQAIDITPDILAAVERITEAVLAYENATGGTRKMGVTGEIGEILACHKLRLHICIDSRSQGFDALDQRGKRVQIKTRRSESGGLPSDAGRVGTFSEHPFDYALLVILDQGYRLAEIWQVNYESIWPLIKKQKRRNPNLSAFKKRATRIWHRE